MRWLVILALMFSTTALASVRDVIERKIAAYSSYPVKVVEIQASVRGFNSEGKYRVLSYRVSPSSGRAWFLLSAGRRSFWVQVKYMVKVPVVIAKGPVERGQVLTAADVEPKYMWLDPMRARGVVSYQDAVGKVATRRIDAGMVLTSSMLKRPLLVKRGELVQFLLNAGGVRITGVAKAMSNGCKGDVVELRNLSSGRVFAGEVIAEGRVLVR